MKTKYTRILTLALVFVLIFNMLPVGVSAAYVSPSKLTPQTDSAFMDYQHPETPYDVIDDNSPVRQSPNKNAKVIDRFDSGEIFFGTPFSTGKSTWVRVYSSFGNVYGYIYIDHVQKHTHSLETVYSEGDRSIRVCKCAYTEIDVIASAAGTNTYKVDCNGLVCELVCGRFSKETSALAEGITLTYDILNIAVCATALTNPASAVACAVMSAVSAVASARDLTADVIYCFDGECNPVNLLFDAKGIVSSAKVSVKYLKGLETYRAGKTMTELYNDFVSDTGKYAAKKIAEKEYEILIQRIDGSTVGFFGAKSTLNSTAVLRSYNAPTNLDVGDCYSIYGTLESVKPMKKVVVGVFDKQTGGTRLTGGQANVSATSYDIHKLDADVRFNDLSTGIYWYQIIVDGSVMLNREFSVGDTGITSGMSPKLSGENYPTTINVGRCFSIMGTISSGELLEKVTVGVYKNSIDEDVITGDMAYPNAYQYDLVHSDANVLFNNLSAGTYHYRVVAYTTSGKHVLLNESFTVS